MPSKIKITDRNLSERNAQVKKMTTLIFVQAPVINCQHNACINIRLVWLMQAQLMVAWRSFRPKLSSASIEYPTNFGPMSDICTKQAPYNCGKRSFTQQVASKHSTPITLPKKHINNFKNSPVSPFAKSEDFNTFIQPKINVLTKFIL